MRVCMKVTVSGTRNGQPWPDKGGIVDLPDDEAKHLIAAGLAKEPDAGPQAEPDVEEASAPAPETSTPVGRKPTAKPKQG